MSLNKKRVVVGETLMGLGESARERLYPGRDLLWCREGNRMVENLVCE